jgi:hypothetical protein
MLAVLSGCGLRRRELSELTFDHLRRREDHWAIVDLIGRAGQKVVWHVVKENARKLPHMI